MTEKQITMIKSSLQADIHISIPGDTIECNIFKNSNSNKLFMIESIYDRDENWRRKGKRAKYYTVTANDYGWNDECDNFAELFEHIKK